MCKSYENFVYFTNWKLDSKNDSRRPTLFRNKDYKEAPFIIHPIAFYNEDTAKLYHG